MAVKGAEPAVHHRPGGWGARPRPAVVAAVGLGGMVGASARYGLARALPTPPAGFPWATWWANVAGSFVLGLLLVVAIERIPPRQLLRPFLATGVLGAFTTMSTYQVETVLLLEEGRGATGVGYALGSLAAGLVVAHAGITVGRRVPLPARTGGAR